jgi:hypothetical protein
MTMDLAYTADSRMMRGRGSGRRGSSGPATTAADVTRQQWAHFVETYKPLEEEILGRAMQTDFSLEGDMAGQTARSSLSSAAGTFERNLRRSGATLTGEERAALNRRRETSRTRASAGAENVTRRTMSETRTNLLANMVGIGKGVAGSARGGLNAVADLEAQRAVFNEQGKTAARNQNLSTAASLAAMAIMFM